MAMASCFPISLSFSLSKCFTCLSFRRNLHHLPNNVNYNDGNSGDELIIGNAHDDSPSDSYTMPIKILGEPIKEIMIKSQAVTNNNPIPKGGG
jgi:hypothetical protein